MTPEQVAEALADVREHLRKVSAADAARRKPCPVCHYNTADLERHERLHAGQS
jgi:hypothetical protein